MDPKLRGGFEDWYGFNVSNNYYRTFYCHGEESEPIPLEGYQTDALTDLSLRYLSENRPHLAAAVVPLSERGGAAPRDRTRWQGWPAGPA